MVAEKMQLASDLIKILRYMNMWPKASKRDFAFYAKLIATVAFCNLVLIGMVLYIHYYITTFGFIFNDLSDAIASSCSAISALMYIYCLNLSQPQIEALLIELGDFTTIEKPRGIEKTDKKVNIFIKVCIMWMCCAVFSSVVYSLFLNCTDNVIDDCGLFVNAYLPFYNLFRYPQRYVLLLCQAHNALSFCIMGFFTDCAMIVPAEYLVNRLAHLKFLLREIPGMEIERRKEHVNKCVLYHYKILELSEKSTAANYTFFMVHITSSSLIIALIVYQLLVNFKFIMFVHLSCWIIIISACCLMGERLIGASIELAEVVYESIPWDGDLVTQKTLLLMLIRAQTPLCVPGGLEKYLSHELLLKIMKGTYSFITLMME